MNIALDKLCVRFELSDKIIYEIKQVYELLDHDGKKNLLGNFEPLVQKLNKIEKDSIAEQEILLDSTWNNIKNIEKK